MEDLINKELWVRSILRILMFKKFQLTFFLPLLNQSLLCVHVFLWTPPLISKSSSIGCFLVKGNLWSTKMNHALLRLPDVQRLTGLSRSSIYRLEGEGAFPRRVRLSERATAWREDELVAWLDARPRVNGQTRAKELIE